jgi:hypothetical protein
MESTVAILLIKLAVGFVDWDEFVLVCDGQVKQQFSNLAEAQEHEQQYDDAGFLCESGRLRICEGQQPRHLHGRHSACRSGVRMSVQLQLPCTVLEYVEVSLSQKRDNGSVRKCTVTRMG